MRRLDQRRFAHAARAPQQRIVGRQGVGEPLGVFDQHVAHPIDALEQRHVDPVDAGNGGEPAPFRVPDERIGRIEARRCRRRRCQPLERVGDAVERRGKFHQVEFRFGARHGKSGLGTGGLAGPRRPGKHPLSAAHRACLWAQGPSARRSCASFGPVCADPRRCNWARGGYSPRRFRRAQAKGVSPVPRAA